MYIYFFKEIMKQKKKIPSKYRISLHDSLLYEEKKFAIYFKIFKWIKSYPCI